MGQRNSKKFTGKNKGENGNKERKQEVIDQQFFAAGLAGTYKMNDVTGELIAIFKDTTSRDYVRSESLKSLMKIDPAKYAAVAGEVLQNPSTTGEFKRGIVSALCTIPSNSVNKVMAAVKNPSPDLQQVIVWALASTESGKSLLFEKVKKGEVFARTLVDPDITGKINVKYHTCTEKIFDELTANLEAVDKEKTGYYQWKNCRL